MVSLLCPLGCMICPLHISQTRNKGCSMKADRYRKCDSGDYEDHHHHHMDDSYSLNSKKSNSLFHKARKRKRKKTKKKKKEDVVVVVSDPSSMMMTETSLVVSNEVTNEEHSTCHPQDTTDSYQEKQNIVSLVDHLQQNRNSVHERVIENEDEQYTSDSADSLEELSVVYVTESDENSLETKSEHPESDGSCPSRDIQNDETIHDVDSRQSSSQSESQEVLPSLKQPLEKVWMESESISQVSLPSGLMQERIKEQPRQYSTLGSNWLRLLNRAHQLQQRMNCLEQCIPPTITVVTSQEQEGKKRDVSPDDSETAVTTVSTLASSRCSSFSSKDCEPHKHTQEERTPMDKEDRRRRVEFMMDDSSKQKFRDAIEYINFMSSEDEEYSLSVVDDCSSISSASVPEEPVQHHTSSKHTNVDPQVRWSDHYYEPNASTHHVPKIRWSDNYEIDDYNEETEGSQYPFQLVHRSQDQYENDYIKCDDYRGAFCESDEDDYDYNKDLRIPTRMETIREEQEEDSISRNTCSTDSLADEVSRLIQRVRTFTSSVRR